MSSTFLSAVASQSVSLVSTLSLQVLSSSEAAIGGHRLASNPYDGVAFSYNDQRVVLVSPAIDAALDYAELLAALRSAIATVPALAGVTAALGANVTAYDTSGKLLLGQEIVLSSSTGVFSVDAGSGWLATGGLPADVSVMTRMSVGSSVVDNGNQFFNGTAANDVIAGGPGSDVIDGGPGLDTAVFSGSISDYSIRYDRSDNTATVTGSMFRQMIGLDGSDTLMNIERLQFADKTFELNNLPRTMTPGFGKSDSFLFDAAFYLLEHPYLVPTVTLSTALNHYKATVGNMLNSASPNVWFDPAYYASKWPDLAALNLDAGTLFAHYNLYGVWEGRSAGPAFDDYDGARYLRENPDVAAYVDANVKDFLYSRSNGAIAHYVIYGADEGRVAYAYDGAAIDLTILVGV